MTTTTQAPQLGAADDPAAVLAVLRDRRSAADRAEVEQMRAALAWAMMHSLDSLPAGTEAAADQWVSCLGKGHAVPIAGPGAPQVAEFCIEEFATAIGKSTDSGRRYLGLTLEAAYRLPRVWARMVAADLPAWKARWIAERTMNLPKAGAAFVDRHVAAVAHKIGPAQLDRLVAEALARFDPEAAAKAARDAAESRKLDVRLDGVGVDGTVAIEGRLDLVDALDFDAALAEGAAELKALGSDESLDVRRSQAAGLLARRQLAFEFSAEDSDDTADGTADGTADDTGGDSAATAETGSRSRPPRSKRTLVIHTHVAAAALAGRTGPGAGIDLVRIEQTGGFLTLDQLRAWCADADTQITVKGVLDLDQHIHVDSYEVPDRLAEQATLRDHSCVFPWCTRPARKSRPDQHDADCDHVIPHARGGSTCTCNIAPLCRRHHRLKTHTAWTYVVLEPGSYLWTSPHGYQFLRDHEGSLDVTADHRRHQSRPVSCLLTPPDT